MLRATEKILSALAGLQGNEDWNTVKEWVLAIRDDDVKTLTATKDEVTMRWLQGSVQTLSTLVDTADSAMETIYRKRTEK